MFHSFGNWIQSQKRTRRFHPSWILLVVAVTLVVAGIIWIPAEWIAKAEHGDRAPAMRLPAGDESSLPREEAPAGQDPWDTAKPIWVDFSIPAGDGVAHRRPAQAADQASDQT